LAAMGASASVPFKDPAKEEMTKNLQREAEELKADLKKTRDELKSVIKSHSKELDAITKERLNDEKEHLYEMRKEAEKVDQTRTELTEKIINLPKETTDRVLALERAHNETMTKALTYIQTVPRSIEADKEAAQLDAHYEEIRANISQIRTSYAELCELVIRTASEAEIQEEAKKMSQLCEKG
ncbi:hypothetical protein PMAYCL1PPCAC_13093, partial [Pristionchus mayeri]